jgi:hypothetical protein
MLCQPPLHISRPSSKGGKVQKEAKLKRFTLVIAACALVSACATIRLVSDYDEVIDKGVADFSEKLGAHVKNMAELAGKPDGTYDATLTLYNELDAKLDTLIARASNGSDGKECRLQGEVLVKIKNLLHSQTPPQLQQGPDATPATANACSSRLLVLVKQQLGDIREIHKTTDKCGPQSLSCLRPATAQTALAIATQSANAVAIVETAKKSR